MRNTISILAVLISTYCNAQYSEMLHAYITPTNKVVTGVPDWVKGSADYFTFGNRKEGSVNGFLSFAQGTNVVASGDFSFASGKSTLASAESSHAEGNGTIASGYASHAEGCTTVAKGNCSHAEGRYTTAIGTYSHSSGVSSLASNNYSYVWSGVLPPINPNDKENKYGSNGEGTFNVNPIGGEDGFYIGTKSLKDIIQSYSSSKTMFQEVDIVNNGNNITINPRDGCSNFNTNVLVNYTSGEPWSIVVSGTYYTYPDYEEFRVEAVLEEGKNFDIEFINGNTYEVTIKYGSSVELSGYDKTIYLLGATLTCKGYTNPIDYTPAGINALYISNFSSYVYDSEDSFFPDSMYGARNDSGKEIPININLPTSDNPVTFSLYLNVDINVFNKTVSWNGGTIIEKFAGSSSLLNGTTIFEVKEVIPNVFIVDRCPSEISIKGDNGNNYTLNIDNEGILEVRSKE